MTFDPVHDSQAIHRALVLAFSFPGKPVPIDPVRSDGLGPLPPVLAAVALTLLDPETTYWAPPGLDLPDITAVFRPASEAAFLLVPSPGDSWTQAFESAGRGTLADPHRGATVVAWAPAQETAVWRASGPGIEFPVDVALPPGGWVEARHRACREFPLGVDLIWVRDDSLVALPRTTQLVPGQEV